MKTSTPLLDFFITIKVFFAAIRVLLRFPLTQSANLQLSLKVLQFVEVLEESEVIVNDQSHLSQVSTIQEPRILRDPIFDNIFIPLLFRILNNKALLFSVSSYCHK